MTSTLSSPKSPGFIADSELQLKSDFDLNHPTIVTTENQKKKMMTI